MLGRHNRVKSVFSRACLPVRAPGCRRSPSRPGVPRPPPPARANEAPVGRCQQFEFAGGGVARVGLDAHVLPVSNAGQHLQPAVVQRQCDGLRPDRVTALRAAARRLQGSRHVRRRGQRYTTGHVHRRSRAADGYVDPSGRLGCKSGCRDSRDDAGPGRRAVGVAGTRPYLDQLADAVDSQRQVARIARRVGGQPTEPFLLQDDRAAVLRPCQHHEQVEPVAGLWSYHLDADRLTPLAFVKRANHEGIAATAAPWDLGRRDANAFVPVPRAATCTVQARPPPLRQNCESAKEVSDSLCNPPYSLSMSAKDSSGTAAFMVPFGNHLTNAPMAVGTPVMGCTPLGITSMYTPG